jgi:hypothetical protein
VVTQALAVIFPNDPPRFMARTPHGYHDVEQIREQLRAAGFAEIAIDAVSEKSKAPSPRDAAVGFFAKERRCAMKSRPATLRASNMRRRKPPRLSRAGLAMARSKDASGRL